MFYFIDFKILNSNYQQAFLTHLFATIIIIVILAVIVIIVIVAFAITIISTC